MQLKNLFLFAAPLVSLVAADGAAIGAAMQTIADDSTNLNTIVSGFEGGLAGIGDSLKILIASTKLLIDINNGTSVAEASANLTLVEAITLAGQTRTLATNVNQTLTTIIDKKPVFDASLLSPIVLLNLESEKSATDKFSAAVLEKIPAALQPIAAALIAPIDDAFAEAISTYQLF